MNNWKKVIVLSGLCSCALSVNAMASTNLETGSSLAGISVALNNYYAGNTAASPAARQETPVRQRLPRRPRPNQSPRRMTTLPCPR